MIDDLHLHILTVNQLIFIYFFSLCFVARDVELRVRKEDEQSIAIKLPVTDTVKVAKQKIQVD